MKNRIISMVLLAAMLISCIPTMAFAEGPAPQEEVIPAPAAETVEQDPALALANVLLAEGGLDDLIAEVKDDLHALDKEAAEAGALAAVTGRPIIAAEEAAAVADAVEAEQNLNMAGTVVNHSQTYLNGKVDEAEAAQADAEAALPDAEDAKADAEDALADAADALTDAEDAKADAEDAKSDAEDARDAAQDSADKITDIVAEATTPASAESYFTAREEAIKAQGDAADAQDAADAAQIAADAAQDAADEAQTAADAAQAAADEAQTAADAAQAAADEAQSAYDDAKARYDQMVEATDKLLADGLISMEEAVQRTGEAKALADAQYAILENARQDAVAAAEAAAQARVDAAAALLDSANKLAEDLVDNGLEVVKDAAVVAALGAAMSVTETAAAVADLVVDYRKAELAELREKVAELEEAMKVAEDAIKAAEAALEGAIEDRDAAEAALADAQKAWETANMIWYNASAIIASRTAELEADMTAAQDAVKNGDADADQIAALTKLVLENLNKIDPSVQYKDVTPVPGKDGVFSATKVVGGEDVPVFIVAEQEGEAGEMYLQFYSAEENDKPINSSAEMGSANSYSSASFSRDRTSTTMSATNADDETMNIVVTRNKPLFSKNYSYSYQVQVGSNYIDLNWDSNGAYYISGRQKHYVNVTDSSDQVYDKADKGTDSNFITDAWEGAKNPATLAKDRLNELLAATDAFEKAQQAVDILTNERDFYQGMLDGLTETRDKTQKDADDLEKLLEGDLMDVVVVAIVQEGLDLEQIEVLLDSIKTITDADTSFPAILVTVPKVIGALGDIADILGGSAGAIINEVIDELRADPANAIQTLRNAFDMVDDLIELIDGLDDGIGAADIEKALDVLRDAQLSPETYADVMHILDQKVTDAYAAARENLEAAVNTAGSELSADTAALVDAVENLLQAEAAYVNASARQAVATALAENAAQMKKQADEAAAAAQAAKDAYEALVEAFEVDDSQVVAAKAAADAAQAAADSAQAAADDAQAAADTALNDALLALDAAEEAAQIAAESQLIADEAAALAKQAKEDAARLVYLNNPTTVEKTRLEDWAGTWAVEGAGEVAFLQISSHSIRFLNAKHQVLHEGAYVFADDQNGAAVFKAVVESGACSYVALGAHRYAPLRLTTTCVFGMGVSQDEAAAELSAKLYKRSDAIPFRIAA